MSESRPALDEVLESVSCLTGQTRVVTALPGGLTNENYRVRTATRDVVLRLSPASTGMLAVDREAEHRNALAAARAGVGPAVVDYLPGRGVFVVEYLPSTTFTNADVAARLPEVADVVRRLHGGAPFANRFDMFDIQRRYLRIMQDNGFRMPQGYLDQLGHAHRMEAALGRHPQPGVPCHNDLLAANFLDDGERLWIIDYEYSGTNEASFELGNLAQEAGLPQDGLEAVVEAYVGAPDPVLAGRAELWAVAAAYAWTLWGTIQAGASDLPYDFWEWGMEKYDAAQAAFGGSRFGPLLDRVGQG